ncbi:hypothetical protein [Moorena sp. SIO4E2]|uniref:hypothetical protein n=1 Tax=Moorena sp. SIO4E2 TaxID=2607826 RepID=UPI00257E6388|nr:hypothetical protein [Moorena sp. SIO4E2]
MIKKDKPAMALHKCGMIVIVFWGGHLGEMGILVEQPSWWNSHLGEMAILVERASW